MRGFTVIQITVFMVGMCFYSSAILWPQQVTILYTQDGIKIGAWSGATGYAAAFSLFAAVLYHKVPGTNVILTISILAIAVCSGAQAIVSKYFHSVWGMQGLGALLIVLARSNFSSRFHNPGHYRELCLSCLADGRLQHCTILGAT
jgi:hypothetical protein